MISEIRDIDYGIRLLACVPPDKYAGYSLAANIAAFTSGTRLFVYSREIPDQVDGVLLVRFNNDHTFIQLLYAPGCAVQVIEEMKQIMNNPFVPTVRFWTHRGKAWARLLKGKVVRESALIEFNV